MNSRSFQRAVLIMPLFLGLVQLSMAEKNEKSASKAASAAMRGQTDPAAELVQLKCTVVELKGNVQRALKSTGLDEEWAKRLRAGGGKRRADSGIDEETTRQIEMLRQYTDVETLFAPRLNLPTGQTGLISTSAGTSRLPYLVRTGEKSFALEYSTVDSLGMRLEVTPRSVPGHPGEIHLAPIKVSITTVDGREAISGVDLDVGKPIISTRTLETSITIADGRYPVGILLPGPEGRQPVLLLAAERVREPRPGEAIPNPGAMVPIRNDEKRP